MSTRYEKLRQNAEKMLIAFLQHWEHPGIPEGWGPAAHGLLGGALAGLVGISARRTEIQASLRMMVSLGWIERCQTPDLWIEDIIPELMKIHGKDMIESGGKVQQLSGNSSDPDTWWYILTQSGIEHARWLKLPKWRRRFIIARGFVSRHAKKIIIGVIISLIAAAIWAIVQGYFPLE